MDKADFLGPFKDLAGLLREGLADLPCLDEEAFGCVKTVLLLLDSNVAGTWVSDDAASVWPGGSSKPGRGGVADLDLNMAASEQLGRSDWTGTWA